MTTANFPLPVPNLDNQEFWDQCRQHRLVLRRCLDCRSFYHPPRPNCPECASSNLEWVESPGKGKVYTYVITRQPVNPAFRERLPGAWWKLSWRRGSTLSAIWWTVTRTTSRSAWKWR